jgi:hypothetical protein
MDVESLLFLNLESFFEKQDFDLLLEKKQFRKNTEQGFQNIILSISKYEQESLIEFNIGVRLDIVENLVNQFTQHLIDFQADTNTLLTSMGRLLNEPFLRFKVKSEDDLFQVCQKLCKFMTEQGFSFLEQVSHSPTLDQVINRNPEQAHPYFYNSYHRALKGITLAKLNYNPDFEGLAQTYYQQLIRKNAPPSQQENFQKLYRYLHNFSVN